MRLINADALIETIRRLPNAGIHWFVSAEAVFDAILNAPTIKPEQQVGKWESQKGGGYKCSECGQYALDEIEGNYIHVAARTPYCPFCGKKME